MGQLDEEIGRLTRERVLSPEQAERLRAAAGRDLSLHQGPHLTPIPTPATVLSTGMPADSAPGGPARTGAVLEVLGYLGGALLLGALIFLGVFLWDDLDVAGRRLVAVASFLIPAAGGLVLVRSRVRRDLGTVLLALACLAAGFAWVVLAEDESGVASSAVVLVTSAVGAVIFRAGALLVSGWVGAMVFAVVVLEQHAGERDDLSFLLAIAFLLICCAFGAVGAVLSRTLAWSLAGLAGWAAALSCLVEESGGAWLALLIATVVSGLLLTAFVRTRAYVLAALGCLVLLTLWPSCLYEIFNSAIGVATGLVAAGGVLIATVVVMSRLRRGPAPAGSVPQG